MLPRKITHTDAACQTLSLDVAKTLNDLIDHLTECADIPKEEEPILIQGYTREQWQEIVGGKYLVCLSDVEDRPKNTWRIDTLESVDTTLIPFRGTASLCWRFCKPAQIKGVLRPIFVKPVEPLAYCVFFDKNGHPVGLHLGKSVGAYTYDQWVERLKEKGAVSYMEK